MKQIIYDKAIIDHVDSLPNGAVIVRSRVARTGIQSYLRSELGDAAPVGNPDDVLKIYRPGDQVFADRSVNGWAHVPVTLEHPTELVDTVNMDQYAVGHVTPRAKIDDDGWFWLEAVIDTANAIKAIKDGTHKEWSGGYTAVMDMTPGMTPGGLPYDGIQTNITPNHLAMVPNGRANEGIINDAVNWDKIPDKKEADKLAFTKVKIGDASVSVIDADVAVFDKIVTDHAAVIVAKDTAIGTLKAELATALALVLSDADLDAKVTALAEQKDMLAKVTKAFGDEAVKDASPAEIAGMFKVIGTKTSDALGKIIGDKVIVGDADPWAEFKKGQE